MRLRTHTVGERSRHGARVYTKLTKDGKIFYCLASMVEVTQSARLTARLRRARRASKLTWREFAAELQIPQRTLIRIADGIPVYPRTADAVREALDKFCQVI